MSHRRRVRLAAYGGVLGGIAGVFAYLLHLDRAPALLGVAMGLIVLAVVQARDRRRSS